SRRFAKAVQPYTDPRLPLDKTRRRFRKTVRSYERESDSYAKGSRGPSPASRRKLSSATLCFLSRQARRNGGIERLGQALTNDTDRSSSTPILPHEVADLNLAINGRRVELYRPGWPVAESTSKNSTS